MLSSSISGFKSPTTQFSYYSNFSQLPQQLNSATPLSTQPQHITPWHLKLQSDDYQDAECQKQFLFPKLPAPLETLNGRTLKSIVTAIAKDLRVSWDGESPEFWPENVPFRNPRNIPKEFKGTWSNALREVVAAAYEHCGLDPGKWVEEETGDKTIPNSSSSTTSPMSSRHLNQSLPPSPVHHPITQPLSPIPPTPPRNHLCHSSPVNQTTPPNIFHNLRLLSPIPPTPSKNHTPRSPPRKRKYTS